MHRIVSLIALCAVTVLAADAVFFRNGVRIEVARVEREGTGVWLYSSNGMVTNVDMRDILRIEAIVPPGTAAAAAPPPVYFTARQTNDPTKNLVERMAAKHGVDPDLVHAVVKQESNYHARAYSSAGAIGLMQLMPGTAKELRADPWDPEENVDAGIRYLKQMLIKYRNHPRQVALALAAYNAGPHAVDRYRGVPPYRETRQYVRKIITHYNATPDRVPQPSFAGGGQP